MNISELSNSNYLSKKDLVRPILATIARVEHENVAMEGEEEKLRYVLYFEGLHKGLVLNVTNGALIAQATGSEESDGWIGRQIVLYHDPSVMMRGKAVGGIRVRAPRNQVAPAAPVVRAPAPRPPPPPPVTGPAAGELTPEELAAGPGPAEGGDSLPF